MSYDPGISGISGASDVFLNNPQDSQVLGFSTGTGKWQNQTIATVSTETFTNMGALVVGTGANRLYNDSGIARTITAVRASVGTAPTGSNLIVDVNIDGTTIFPTQSERPTVITYQVTSGIVSRSTTWANGSYVTIDIDQIGSTAAGADLTVTVTYS